MSRLIVFILIAIVGGGLGGWMWSKLSKPENVHLSMPIAIGSALCILLGLYGLHFNSATSARIIINQPTQQIIRETQIQIEGTVSPADSQVYVLVRPEEGNVWWVQPPPLISGDGLSSGTTTWAATVYLGNEQEGKYRSFEIVALASTNAAIVDFLSGNYLTEGSAIKNIPVLSRSNVIVVVRE